MLSGIPNASSPFATLVVDKGYRRYRTSTLGSALAHRGVVRDFGTSVESVAVPCVKSTEPCNPPVNAATTWFLRPEYPSGNAHQYNRRNLVQMKQRRLIVLDNENFAPRSASRCLHYHELRLTRAKKGEMLTFFSRHCSGAIASIVQQGMSGQYQRHFTGKSGLTKIVFPEPRLVHLQTGMGYGCFPRDEYIWSRAKVVTPRDLTSSCDRCGILVAVTGVTWYASFPRLIRVV